jgi:hypothetical protein
MAHTLSVSFAVAMAVAVMASWHAQEVVSFLFEKRVCCAVMIVGCRNTQAAGCMRLEGVL